MCTVNIGELDALKTRMYIPQDCLYESAIKKITSMENISVDVLGSSELMSTDRLCSLSENGEE